MIVLTFSFVACKNDSTNTEKSYESYDGTDVNGTESGTENDGTDESTPPSSDEENQPPVTQGKAIDLYLIAGQSNAAGHTKVTNASELYDLAPELRDGFSNVLYAGDARSDGDGRLYHNQQYWTPVKLGFGRYDAVESYMGPEVGMAKALSAAYNKDSGKTAGIFKFAHGGTSIFDVRTGKNAFGNWVCPSYAKSQGLSYNEFDITGGLYRGFLSELEKQIKLLHTMGYTEINICGLYWMQGENDRNLPEDYKEAFNMFASDIRLDILKLMTDLNIKDSGAENMPIFIGSISETYWLNNAGALSVNERFIEAQRWLATHVENCYFIDNSKYKLTAWDQTNNQTIVDGGCDFHHWNQTDMFNIGMSVGTLMQSPPKKISHTDMENIGSVVNWSDYFS